MRRSMPHLCHLTRPAVSMSLLLAASRSRLPAAASRCRLAHRYDLPAPRPPLSHPLLSASRHPDAPHPDMDNPYVKEKVQCILCKYKIELNYKVSLSLNKSDLTTAVFLATEHPSPQPVRVHIHGQDL